MKLLPAFTFILFFLFSTMIVEAGESISLSPDGSHSNQNQINEALMRGNVYLSAGVYEVDNTIVIPSNRFLSGSSDAIIRVYSGSSQWFTGSTGVISCSGSVDNVEIFGFQIDGNIGNLPKSYSDSRSDTDHDCEKLIILRGYSNQFAQNIKIHDMKLYNSFSDGIYIILAESVDCYRNFISNCQHEGIYLSCVKKGLFRENKIAGITSDCGRLDNCVDCKVYSNFFFSYNGESYGAYKGGQAGLQIADAGSSHGYDASYKPLTTTNIEVYNNTFADPGRKAVWLDSTGKGVTNVFIHDNEFIDAAGLETKGIPVGDISVDNPPSVEMSEKVFSSIFDILDRKFTFNFLNLETEINATVDVAYYNNSYNPHSLIYVTGENLSSFRIKYGNQSVSHYLKVSEGSKVVENDLWQGDLPNRGNAVYLEGQFNESQLKVTVFNTKGYDSVEQFNVTEVHDQRASILSPNLWSFVGTLLILGIFTIRNFRRITKW